MAPEVYKPKENMFSDQIQKTESALTWDKDDPERQVLKAKDFTNIPETELLYVLLNLNDIRKYLASSTDSDSSEDEKKKQKLYKSTQ